MVDAGFEFPHVDLVVAIGHQRQVPQRLGEVPPTTASAVQRARLVERGCQQDHATQEVPFHPTGDTPGVLEGFVTVPVRAGVEQGHATRPGVGIDHLSSIRAALRYPDVVRSEASNAGTGGPATGRRIVVGVSGGSGIVYARDLLRTLRAAGVAIDLVVSAGAKHVIAAELDGSLHDLEALADVVHKDTDLGASIASGSHRFDGMAIVPCSAGTLAKVAQGFTDTLLTRAAHVTLKERRPLVVVVREAPYSRPMLVNMLAANDAGAVVMPASPGFYHRPQAIEDLLGSVTGRVLDHLGVPHARTPRWKEEA